MTFDDKSVRDIASEIITCLVRKEYERLEAMTCGIRLSAGELRSVMDDYGRTLVPPPEGAADGIDIRQIQGADPPAFSVWCNLWTAEEGRSDLTLELNIAQSHGCHRIEIDNLHVR